MFGQLFKKKECAKKNMSVSAEALYASVLLNTREEIFYVRYGVPDTFDGRFDLLLLHIFIILHCLMGHDEYEALSQALFDVTFKDMDQTLREIGIGDVGVPKHLKRMMKAFNGRMHSYEMALAPERLKDIDIEGLMPTTLDEALKRNLYGTVIDNADWDPEVLPLISNFIHNNINNNACLTEDMIRGNVRFINE